MRQKHHIFYDDLQMQHSHLRLCCTVSNHVCAEAPALPCSSGSEAPKRQKPLSVWSARSTTSKGAQAAGRQAPSAPAPGPLE